MALSVGIVGLPNVGKSTAFNALSKAQNAEAANYPFCTIEPNKAVVPVPDPRLDALAAIAKPEKVLHSTVEFYDIAGLVAGASKGEGLGNKFLGHIRETAAIVHVVRCFDDDNVVHVDGSPDPARDVETINTELILADLETLERRIERLEKSVRTDKSARGQLDEAQHLLTHMGEGLPASTYTARNDDAFAELSKEVHPITAKPVIFVANVNEEGLAGDNAYVTALRALAADQHAEVVVLCAKLEEEMAGLSDAERDEFLESMDIAESGLDQVIHKGYAALGLISYFTAGPKEVRAWQITRGWKAPKAASVIHTDFERGFIRAEVIAYDDYIKHQGEAGSKAAGVMRVEGKDYVVHDGDVMHFRFNV